MSKPLVCFDSASARKSRSRAPAEGRALICTVRISNISSRCRRRPGWASSLTFRISALGQSASGVIDVREDHVQMELQLPWLLHQIAVKAQGLIRKRGQLLLEKK